MSLDQKPEIEDSDDSDDEDYVYTGVGDLPSEEDSEGDPEDDVEGDGDDAPKGGRKRKGSQKNKRNKSSKVRKKDVKIESKADNTSDADEENKQPALVSEEADKKKTDSLWADFLKDTGSTFQKEKASTGTSGKNNNVKVNTESNNKTESQGSDKQNKVLVTKVFHFAGEEVKLTKEVAADSAEAQGASVANKSAAALGNTNLGMSMPSKSGQKSDGLSSVLGQIGKKNKIGTLEKSKIDWEQFKKSKGLEEEIQIHNRGKAGYLEKQDFLQRADVRQFEIEKDMRTRSRSNR